MNKSLVTIIVPMYNSEFTINRMMESLMNQLYKNIEIIIINDGSSDNSRKIIENYMLQDKRIILINQINSGVGSARNKGLQHATGDYITFIDSDDEIESDYIEVLLKTAEKENADVTESGAKVIIDENNKIFPYGLNDKIQINTQFEYIKRYLTFQANVSVWGKLYKREILDGLEFINSNINEDFIFMWLLIQHTKKYVKNNSVLYIYHLDSTNSLSKSYFTRENMNIIPHIDKVINDVTIHFPEIISEAKNYYGAMILHTMILYDRSIHVFENCEYVDEGKILLNLKNHFEDIENYLLLHEENIDKEELINNIELYIKGGIQ